MTVAPYLFNDRLSLDATVGYGNSQTEQFRTAGGTRISSDIEYSKLIGRRHLDEDAVSANVPWSF